MSNLKSIIFLVPEKFDRVRIHPVEPELVLKPVVYSSGLRPRKCNFRLGQRVLGNLT
jgi:hypothetical protein